MIGAYSGVVPKLWDDTIEAHRRGVREAILAATAALVAELGLRAVTMSQIAERTGIGRATLYKYFSDVDAIMRAWHDQRIGDHLAHLAEVRDQAGEPGERLEAVLRAYAVINQRNRAHRSTELGTLLHTDERLATAQRQLHDLVRDLIADAARSGDVRADVSPDELAGYSLHALSAAGALPSAAAVHRLVSVVLAGLRPA